MIKTDQTNLRSGNVVSGYGTGNTWRGNVRERSGWQMSNNGILPMRDITAGLVYGSIFGFCVGFVLGMVLVVGA